MAGYITAGGDPAARHPCWDLLDAAALLPDRAPTNAPGGGAVGQLEASVARVLAELCISRMRRRSVAATAVAGMQHRACGRPPQVLKSRGTPADPGMAWRLRCSRHGGDHG
jgi:hypothetical protein